MFTDGTRNRGNVERIQLCDDRWNDDSMMPSLRYECPVTGDRLSYVGVARSESKSFEFLYNCFFREKTPT